MLTAMSGADWAVVVAAFRAARPRRGAKGQNDRRSLEAVHFFTLHNITWRALPEEFGKWNTVWKRFDRLSRAGVFEAMFDSITARTHTCTAGVKRGKRGRRWTVHAAVSPPRST